MGARLARAVGWLRSALVFGLMLGSATAAAAPLHEGPAPLELTAGDPADPLHFGLGASVWLRGEARAESGPVGWQIPQRTRVQVEARWRGLRSFVQVQDVRAWGTADTITTAATTGIHQGYFELSGRRGRAEGSIRVGRQQHFLGSMRLVGLAPWNPNMRAFDAVRLSGTHGPFSVDVVGALLRRPQTLTVTDASGDARELRHGGEGWLATAVRVQAHRAFDLEGYALLRNYAPTEAEPERERVVFSPGARAQGELGRGFRYDLEGYVQTGRWDGLSHAAWLGAATVGYRFDDPHVPLVEGGYLATSGSGCAEVSGDVTCDVDGHRDFDGLLGARHRFMGIADLFAPTNTHDAWAGLRVSPAGWTELRVEMHHFMLHDPTGRWLRVNEAAVGIGPDPAGTRRTVGEELDLRVNLHPWGPLTAQLGYAMFVPVAAGERHVGSSVLHFAYLMTQVAF